MHKGYMYVIYIYAYQVKILHLCGLSQLKPIESLCITIFKPEQTLSNLSQPIHIL